MDAGRIDVEKVRLTPEQEAARVADLAKRTAQREFDLRLRRFHSFEQLRAEFENLPPDDLIDLRNKLQMRIEAERGAKTIGESLVLSFKGLAKKARAAIAYVMRFMPWNWTKRWAIRTGVAMLLVIGGTLTSQQYDKDGKLVSERTAEINGVTTAGLNHILDTEFHAGTQVTTWYLGLINGSSTPTLAAADTMASHAGWTEYTTYSQTNRVAWDETAAAAGSTTSNTTSDFSMNGSGTVAGGFLTSVSTKSGSTGTLFMTATFSGGNQTVSNGDTLKLTYTLSTTAS
jgi:hypothetical protein